MWYDDAAKECGTLGARALVPSDITYEPKINSWRVQGERTRAGALQDGGTANGGVDTVVEAHGGRGPRVNWVAVLARRPG